VLPLAARVSDSIASVSKPPGCTNIIVSPLIATPVTSFLRCFYYYHDTTTHSYLHFLSSRPKFQWTTLASYSTHCSFEDGEVSVMHCTTPQITDLNQSVLSRYIYYQQKSNKKVEYVLLHEGVKI